MEYIIYVVALGLWVSNAGKMVLNMSVFAAAVYQLNTSKRTRILRMPKKLVPEVIQPVHRKLAV